MQINKIAQMEKTRDAVLVAPRSGLDARLVWLQKRRHLPPFPAARMVAASRKSASVFFL
jgi:hypothetical protein